MSNKIQDMVIRLEKELDSLINMFAFARQSLENELCSGLGEKQLSLTDKDAKKLKELALGMSTAVECKIRFDKAKKELAKNMTPVEEMDAVVAYILTLSSDEQTNLRHRLHDRGIFKWKS
jgi:hypothetical protein